MGRAEVHRAGAEVIGCGRWGSRVHCCACFLSRVRFLLVFFELRRSRGRQYCMYLNGHSGLTVAYLCGDTYRYTDAEVEVGDTTARGAVVGPTRAVRVQ